MEEICPISGLPCDSPKTISLAEDGNESLICINCAAQVLPFYKMLQDIFASVILPEQDKECKTCNIKWSEILNHGKLGCPGCYESFKEELKDIINKIQNGNDLHLGKQPPVSLETLQQRLKKAIEEENYEEAAKLRDSINIFNK